MSEQPGIQAQPPSQSPAGWFPDYATPGLQRWWSGGSWTDYLRPVPQTAPPVGPAAPAKAAVPPVISMRAVPLTPAPPALEPLWSAAAAPDAAAVDGAPAAKKQKWWQNKKVMIPAAIGAVVVAAASVLSATVVPKLLNPTHHLQAMWMLSGDPTSAVTGDPDVKGDWQSCHGTNGYDDFSAGAPATVKDGHGNVVGSLQVTNFDAASLDAMFAADKATKFAGWGDDQAKARSLIQSNAAMGLNCLLYVSGDVKDSDYYTVSLSHRGEMSFSTTDLEKNGWWLALTLGKSD